MTTFKTPGSATPYVVTIRLEYDAGSHREALRKACRDLAWKATTVNVLCVETSSDENFELSPGGES